MVNGMTGEATEDILKEKEASKTLIDKKKCVGIVLPRLVRRAVVFAFNLLMQRQLPQPTEAAWIEMLSPYSKTIYIEFCCRACGAMCQAYNKYGKVMDEHERYGRATCEVLGRACTSAYIGTLGHVVEGRVGGSETTRVYNISSTSSRVVRDVIGAQGNNTND